MKKIILLLFVLFFFGTICKSQEEYNEINQADSIENIQLDIRIEQIEKTLEKSLSKNDEIKESLGKIEKQVQENRINSNTLKDRLNDNYQSLMFLNKAMLGFIAIILAITFALVLKHDYEIKNKAKEQLKECDNLFEDIQTKYTSWIDKVQVDYKNDLQLYNHLYSLKFILLHENPSPEEIYPHLTALINNPKSDFKPTFDKLLRMNIDEELNRENSSELCSGVSVLHFL